MSSTTYYARNREKQLQRSKEYYKENQEKRLEYRRRYRLEKREQIIQDNAKYYQKNIVAERQRAKRRRMNDPGRKFVSEFKESHPCSKCGENRTILLQFHHRNPAEKLFNLSDLKGRHTLDEVKAEIAKCDILCVVCHILLHGSLNRK